MAQFEIPEIKLMLEELRLLRAEVKELKAAMGGQTSQEWLTRQEICERCRISSSQFYREKDSLVETSYAFGARSPRYRLKEGSGAV
ncbi:hypothetical protein FACS1894216_16310 [Synergistales bacterium]|nr:hypothetical protein FACS1894216_16310 [Synergistales bacterium]